MAFLPSNSPFLRRTSFWASGMYGGHATFVSDRVQKEPPRERAQHWIIHVYSVRIIKWIALCFGTVGALSLSDFFPEITLFYETPRPTRRRTQWRHVIRGWTKRTRIKEENQEEIALGYVNQKKLRLLHVLTQKYHIINIYCNYTRNNLIAIQLTHNNFIVFQVTCLICPKRWWLCTASRSSWHSKTMKICKTPDITIKTQVTKLRYSKLPLCNWTCYESYLGLYTGCIINEINFIFL